MHPVGGDDLNALVLPSLFYENTSADVFSPMGPQRISAPRTHPSQVETDMEMGALGNAPGSDLHGHGSPPRDTRASGSPKSRAHPH
jgi:hypothetical protein